jgi:hypothetical protein
VQILLQLVADGAELLLGGLALPEPMPRRSIERIATPGPLVAQADGE